MEALHVYEYQRKITKLLNGANKHACFNVGGGGLLMGIEKHGIK
jgi:hypothetical protein